MLTPGAGARLAALAAAVWLQLAGAPIPAARGDQDMSELSAPDGVWRSRGYGWLWVIEDGRLRTYEVAGSYCIASGRSIAYIADSFRVGDDARSFRIALDDPTYHIEFEKLEALPAACTRKPDASPAGVIAAIEEIFTAHYAFFRERKVDWPAIVRAAKARVGADTSEKALLETIRHLISHFDDDHVSLRARIDGHTVVLNTGEGKALRGVAEQARRKGIEFNDELERWKRAVWTNESVKELLGGTARRAANGNIRYGLIDGDIGFLSVLSMADFAESGRGDAAALNRALDDALALFKGAAAVIVDVSLNDGGHDRLARQLAARFAGSRTLAYSKYPGDAPGSRPQAVHIEPSDRLRYTGPVYLLTSNVTVSAAEIFTMAMRALPNVTHVGQTTRGSLSDQLTKRLPNGWRLTLSNEVYLDADGAAWEGIGIPPEIPVEVFSEQQQPATVVPAVRAVVDCIRRGQCSRS
jgi:carboxyl-terminal processing protease